MCYLLLCPSFLDQRFSSLPRCVCRPCERTEEDKNMIYEELLNVRALRHLTNAVKREVAACVRLQHHPRPGQYCTSSFTSHCWCLCILPPPPSPLSSLLSLLSSLLSLLSPPSPSPLSPSLLSPLSSLPSVPSRRKRRFMVRCPERISQRHH